MIHCPYQPENLRITIWGCMRRKILAGKMDLKGITQGDDFHFAYMTGLLRCRNCPIARMSLHRASRGNVFGDRHPAA